MCLLADCPPGSGATRVTPRGAVIDLARKEGLDVPEALCGEGALAVFGGDVPPKNADGEPVPHICSPLTEKWLVHVPAVSHQVLFVDALEGMRRRELMGPL